MSPLRRVCAPRGLPGAACLVMFALAACAEEPRGPAGCKPNVPAGPATCTDEPATPPSITVDPSSVGAAPLRRLSNVEYRYALADLFPQVSTSLLELPSDGEVGGFDNAAEGQTASDVRISRYEAAAHSIAAASTVDAASVQALVGCAYTDADQAEHCAQQFVAHEGRRLFRRPLSSRELEDWTTRFRRWQQTVDFEGAVQLTLGAMLQAPQFLYRPELVASDVPSGALTAVEPYALASRLSFLLWSSVPDEALLMAAEDNQLRTAAQLEVQARRMLGDPRAARTLWSFHRQWLGLDRILEDEHILRTQEVDVDWSPLRQQNIQHESRLFVENVLLAGGSLRDLLLSPRAWVNEDLAALYGVAPGTAVSTDGFSEVLLNTHERAGILTRAAFMAGTSHRGATSPPIRANALRLRLLCQLPMNAPPGIDTTPPVATEADGPRTNRMLFAERTAAPACQGCHLGLNGIGFALESYNAAGRFSLFDHGLPVDTSGQLLGTDVDGVFHGAIELSQRLAESREVHACAASQWLRYALGRAPEDGERVLIEQLTTRLMQPGGSVLDMLLDVVRSPSFRYQHAEGT